MVSGLDADKKNLPSELHGKGRMLAPAVVDAVEQVDVALYAPQLLFRLARCVDKLGLVGAETVNEDVYKRQLDNFAKYQDNLKALGLDTVLQLQTTALERYNSRVQ